MKRRFGKLKQAIIFSLLATASLNCAAQVPIRLGVEVKYDSVQSLDGSYFAVKENGKWGVVKDCNQILPCSYDYIDALGDGVISFVQNSKVGFADLEGNILIPATYPAEAELPSEDKTQLNLFNEGSCVVYQNGELKLIDKTGKALLGDSLSVISRIGEAVVIKQNGLYGMTNSKGELTIAPQYISLETLVAGKLYVYSSIDREQMPVYGLVSADGKYKTQPQFDEFRIHQSKTGIFVKGFTRMGSQALFSENGDLLVQPLYQLVEPSPYQGLYLISDNLKKGVLSAEGTEYIPPMYDNIQILIKQDTFFVVTDGWKSIVLNKKNETVAAFEGLILDLWVLPNGTLNLLVEQDLAYGLYNSGGKWVIEPQYDEVLGAIGQTLCLRKGKKWGAVNFQNAVVVDFKYEKARLSPSNALVAFFDGGKTSKMLCKDGTVREFPKTESVLAFGDYVEYKIGKKKERLYVDGRKIPAEFLAIASDANGIVCAKTKNGWGYFDAKTFAPLAPQGYDAITNFANDYVFAAKDRMIFVLDRDYKKIGQLELPQGVNLSSLLPAISVYYQLGKPYCNVFDSQTKKTGIIVINQ